MTRTETLLSFAEAIARLPGSPHVSTLHRWRLRGIRGVRTINCSTGVDRAWLLSWITYDGLRH